MGIEHYKLKSKYYLLIKYDAEQNPNYATLAILNNKGIIIANVVDELIDKNMFRKIMNWIPDASNASCVSKSLSEHKSFFSKLEAMSDRINKVYLLTMRSKHINLLEDVSPAYVEFEYGVDESKLTGTKWIIVASSIVNHLIVSKETLIRKINIAKQVMSLPIAIEDIIKLCKKTFSTFEIHQCFNREIVEYCVVIKSEAKTYSYLNEDLKVIYFNIISEH